MSSGVRKPDWSAKAGISRACVHTPRHDGSVRHEHGTYNRALLDRCRCGACTVAMRRRAKMYRVGLRPALPAMVEASAVAEHIEKLRLAGLSYHDIAERAGMSYGSVRRYAYRSQGRCHWATVERLLAVCPTVGAVGVVRGAGYVDATGSRRRLQALAVLGWPLGATADRTGLSRDTLSDIRNGNLTQVRSATAYTLAVAYRRMVVVPPTAAQMSLVSQARVQATRRGWVGPMAWDSSTIDDPAAGPVSWEAA